MIDTLYWIWLTLLPRLGVMGRRKLLREFGAPAALWEADAEALTRAGIAPAPRSALLRKDLGPARAVLERCESAGVRVLCLAEPAYPSRLRLQEDAPTLLYCKGSLPAKERPVIGLVGARASDDAGLELAYRLGAEIAACGGSVATGMAMGIDARSAEGALDQGGAVLGVLGCGVDIVYPRQNAALFARVAERGCLLSEYPPGTKPDARHFPVRNRLISALSDGVAVVRAAERSGSLITARWAAEQGRDVFAVPGDPADPLSRGCNALLRDGAYAAASGWEILERYQFRYPGIAARAIRPQAAGDRQQPAEDAPQPRKDGSLPSAQQAKIDLSSLTPIQRQIVEALQPGPLQLDALIDRLGLPAGQLLPQLTLLQVRKIITQKPGKVYGL